MQRRKGRVGGGQGCASLRRTSQANAQYAKYEERTPQPRKRTLRAWLLDYLDYAVGTQGLSLGRGIYPSKLRLPIWAAPVPGRHLRSPKFVTANCSRSESAEQFRAEQWQRQC